MSIGKVLGQLFLTTEHFDMQTQTQLILLQKTMVTVEGVARSLDADANMWLAMRPVLEDWVKSNIGIKGITIDKWRKLQSFLNDAQDILTKGQDIIQHLHEQQFKMK
jgi:ubiquinone biosynthesis protein